MIEIKNLEESKDFYSNIPAFKNRNDIIVDEYIRIDESIKGRLDTLIEAYYGTTDYIYLVCLFNDIIDINSVNVGDVISLPNLSSLENNIEYISDKSYYITDIKTEETNSNQAVNDSKNKTFTKDNNGIMIF